jgi:hypothetical protein
VPVAASYYNERKDEGLELWVVLGETPNGSAPDLEYCLLYAESHGMNPENLYIDNNVDTGQAWATLFQYIDPSTSEIGLPWAAIVEGVEMTYVWNNVPGVATGTAEQIFDELLGD